jgi:hypothetical protein
MDAFQFLSSPDEKRKTQNIIQRYRGNMAVGEAGELDRSGPQNQWATKMFQTLFC